MSSTTLKPTILSVYCKHKPGGFTKRLYRAWQAIAISGHELVYIATSELPVSGNGIRAVILPMRSAEGSLLYWPEFYLRTVLTLRRLNKQHQVKTHFVFSCFYATFRQGNNINGIPWNFPFGSDRVLRNNTKP